MSAETPDLNAITLRPVTRLDLTMLAEWFARPHVRQWWDAPQQAVDQVRAMLDGRDTARPFIFEIGDKPAGYTQYWFADDDKTEQKLAEFPWLALLPIGSVGIDISIADAGLLSKGIGAAVVRMMAQRLWRDGHRSIIIDPDPNNARAVRAYQKAGFRVADHIADPSGNGLIMQFDPNNANQPA